MIAGAAIVLQARMASQRLPGKALADVAGVPMLGQCLRRLIAAQVAPVVLATTERVEDDALVEVARSYGAAVYRGDAGDVLGRFAGCAAHLGLQLIVRATADNPCVDIDAPARVLECLQYTDAEYIRESGLPHGAAVEGMRADALARAAALTQDPYDREHVTPFLRERTDLFRIVELVAPLPLARPDVVLTVDTASDLQRVRDLYRRTAGDLPPVASFIAAWDDLRRQAAA